MAEIIRRNKWHFIVIAVLALALVAYGFEIEMESDTIRSAGVLTTGFVTSSSQLIDQATQIQLLCSFTVGSSSGCEIKVEFSWDKTNWYQETSTTLTSGVLLHKPYVHGRTVAGNWPISIPIMAKWYRVSSKALVDATSTSLTIVDITGSI